MSDEIKQLVKARKAIEKKIEELKAELETFQLLLRLIDQALSEKSFKTAAELVRTEVSVEENPLKELYIKREGRDLGKIVVYKDRVELQPFISFKPTDSPFNSFFIRRILRGMQREDERALDKGKLSIDDIMRYEIEESEDGFVRKIIVYNYRTESRLREIRNTFRWTLEKLARERY
ncbi:MAG: hypothetical protein DRJ52_00655 [Thermoprotei archaeon]|nr:MAG: hypothetical protein DRJ52_00655 [Thermoprotei archaeon]RLE98002.1 MAG: hypothetical protein DRJ63_08325 [Thermoprotei archaeon]HDI75422.1 hypothetical protein [Thermoprotei archaeon]